MKHYVVLMGPPGAGKGTQAELISEKSGLPHISSGDLFRENIRKKTKLGLIAQSYIDRGELVPDDITISMIEGRINRSDCIKGALLDGFPRTIEQAKKFDELLKRMGASVNCVPYIAAPMAELIERLSGRWTCPICGHVYHQKFHPPRVPGKCDIDDGKLYQREDDKPETVEKRIRVYMERTTPLIEFYQNRGLLVEIDGTKSIEEITSQMLEVLCIPQ